MSGIRLSKKYGVNPSLSQCLICGKDVGVILFGAAWKEKELTQKVLIYLPFDMVRRLKKEAIDEGVSLSALIQGRLGG